MTETVQTIENLALNITKEVRVRASLADTFDALLEHMGPHNSTPEGKPLPMKIEPWPGGRWYRDLGDNNGHFWGHVQAIKRPTLMEITGPLFASYPLLSNVQYRLSESNGETMITFRHTAFGFIPEEQKKNVAEGWTYIFHTYSTYGRGLDILLGVYNFLDLVPKGRDEDGLAFTMAWVRHHDRYEEGYFVDPAATYSAPKKSDASCCSGEHHS